MPPTTELQRPPRLRASDLLWRDGRPAGPGPKPALSLGAIVRAAVDIADRGGVSALTMGNVARQLGVTTMALYRHVPGKEELVDLVIDAALGAPPVSRARGWRARLAAWARAELQLFRNHPWLLDALIVRGTVGPNWTKWLESALQALAGLDVAPRQKIAVVFLVDGHVRSAAQIMLSQTGSGEWARSYEDAIGRALQTDRYPALAALAAAGAFDEPSRGEDDAFEFGLKRLLDGIDAYRAGRAETKP